VQSTPLVGRDGNLVGMVSTHWRDVSVSNDEAMRRLDKVIEAAAVGTRLCIWRSLT